MQCHKSWEINPNVQPKIPKSAKLVKLQQTPSYITSDSSTKVVKMPFW